MAANVEERMVRLENRVDAVVHDVGELKGAYSHLATKADIEALKGWMLWRILLAVAIMQGLTIGAITWLP